ncbi:MAG: type II toxin-antitoxin system VapC family toxin [Dysgonamonadaceae bacterium]|jgi:predicted nucleic acid-binding protein|nr:type II toxin-antitoxin system VapC family toxin [Dysgonamonadaceae bacterium]
MGLYLIDTNIISDYLSAHLPPSGMMIMDLIVDDGIILSVITQIELLCWNTDEATEQLVKSFIGDSNILGISPAIIAQCVAIRKGKKVKTPDAIIASTALANDLTLVTNNEKDFVGIDGLRLLNPYKS